MKTQADLQAFLQHLSNQQATCTHEQTTGVWPRKGSPRLVCFGCGFARTMTAQEIKTRMVNMKEAAQ